jgi:autotransporter-associated beta strand protein
MNLKNNSKQFFKHVAASALLLAGFAVPAQAIDIVFSGTNQVEDQALVSFLQGNFSDVNITYGNFSDYAANAAVIEAADLFILGRQLSSAAYANATNSASFNALTVPTVAFTSYVTRPLDNRWGWHSGDVAAGLSVVGSETTVTAAGASVFGVAEGAYDWFPEPTTFNAAGTGTVGDGEILATLGGNILAAHWDAGDLSGTGVTFGSERLLFNMSEAGTGGITYLPNATGQQALINALVAYTPLTVVSDQWNVNGGGSFNTPGNWSENAVPTQSPVFGSVLTAENAPATITLDSSVSLTGVSFQNPNQYILAGPGTLTLTGAREVAVGAGAHQITANVAGTAGIVKSGSGTLVLPNAKSYTGTSDVQAGTLLLNNLDAIDNQASGTLNVETGGTVNLGTGATGTLAAQLTGSGVVRMLAELAPANTVTIARSNASFSGAMLVESGTLQVTHSDALGSGAITASRTEIELVTPDSAGKVALSGGVTIASEFLDIDARGTTAVALTSSGSNAWNGVIQGQTTSADNSFVNIESTSGTLSLNQLYSLDTAVPHRFVFTGAGNTTITGRLSDAAIDIDSGIVSVKQNDNVSVIKRGSGTLTIGYATTAENDYWFGPTVIEQGSLVVNASGGTDGELRSSSITVNSGATFNISAFTEYTQQIGQAIRGSGSIAVGAGHNLRLVDVSTVAPGDQPGAVGTLTVQSGTVTLPDLGLGGGGVWSFDVGNTTNTTGDRLNVAAGSFTGTSTGISVNVTPAYGHLDAGSRTIISHTGGANAAMNGIAAQITDVNGNVLNTRQTVAINGNTAGQVNVVVTGEEASRTWNGNASGAWDVATTNNWQGGDLQYRDLDRVTFNDSATGTTNVAVDGARFPGSVTFANASKEYTLSGTGGITGTGSVSVNGTGQVTLANTGNNYSGNTTVAVGGKLRMTSATTGTISNSGTFSLGVPVDVEALVQNGAQTIGANIHKVFAVEAENYQSQTVNNSGGAPTWDALIEETASAGEAIVATPTSVDNLSTVLASQNYVTYSLKFSEPGTYAFYSRMKGVDHDNDASTFNDDSVWLPSTDLGNGVSDPQLISTRLDLGSTGSAVNAEGAHSGGNALNYDWYQGRGQGGGFNEIVVTADDVSVGTVFQLKVATRETGAALDKLVLVQNPDFVTDPAFGTITDADLDTAAVITSTTIETVTTPGSILNVNGNFTMSGNSSVLNMLIGAPTAHDQINVTGNLAADGILNIGTGSVSLAAQAGDSFDIFSFASVSGSFDAINLPTLSGGLGWDTSSLLVNGQLAVVSVQNPGDFDGDGDVDGRDFLAWQRGQSPNPLSAGDLAVWQANYGQAGPLTASSTAVPEPGATVLILLGIAGLSTRARRGYTRFGQTR